MYAVVNTGGKQYFVQKGDILKIEKIDAQVGDVVELDTLATSNEGEVALGDKVSSKVKAKVLSHGRGEKIIVFKYKPKKDYRRKKGHRQPYTEIEIESI